MNDKSIATQLVDKFNNGLITCKLLYNDCQKIFINFSYIRMEDGLKYRFIFIDGSYIIMDDVKVISHT